MSWKTEFEDLLRQGNATSNEAEECQLLERAIDLADANDDADAGYRARQQYISPANFTGRADLAFTAFVWCLSRLDVDPARKDLEEKNAKNGGGLFWEYKWIADNAPAFPSFEREQLLALLDDMRVRYEHLGIGRQSLHGVATEIFWLLGENQRSFTEQESEQNTPRDRISDCAACVLNRRVETLVRQGRDADAILAARPITDRRMSCRVIPQATFAALLECYRRTGMKDHGLTALRALLPRIGRSANDLAFGSQAVNFLALTSNFAKAVSTAQRHLRFLPHATQTYSELQLLNAVTLLLMCLQDHGQKTITLRFPATHPDLAQERWKVPELLALVERKSHDLAQRFDVRNGNQELSARRTALLDLRTSVVSWSLSDDQT